MKIHTLKIKDFCNIESLDIRFAINPIMNLITGDNGSGKSSILKAISYALLRSTEGATADFIRWGQSGFYIEVSFEHRGTQYKMTVSFSKKGKSGTSDRVLHIQDKDGVQVRTGADALSYMENILGSNSASYSIFAAQGDMDFIYAAPASRRQILQNLYDLTFKKELQISSEKLEGAKQKRESMGKTISWHKGKLEGLNILPVPELPFAPAQHTALVEEQTKTKDEITRLTQRIQEYEVLGKEKRVSVESVKAAEQALSIFSRQHPEGKTKEEYGSARDAALSEIEKAIADLLRTKKPGLRPRKEPEDGSRKKGQLEDLWKEKSKDFALLENKYRTLKADTGVCPTCGAKRLPADPVQLQQLEEALDCAKKELLDIESQRDELEKVTAEYLKHQARVNEILTYNAKIDETVFLKKNELDRVQKEYANILSQFDAKEKERQALQEALVRAQDNLESLTERCNKFFGEDISLDDMQRQVRHKQEVLHSIDQKLLEYAVALKQRESAEAHNKEVALAKQDLENQLSTLLEAEQESIKDVSEWEEVRLIFKTSLPTYVLDGLTKSLESAANEFFTLAYHGRYQIRLQDNGKAGIDLLYGSGNVWKPASGASGAERSLINLGLKVGLSHLSGLGLLVLDEVDAYLSTENAAALFDILRKQLQSGGIDQIFVISHDELIKETLGASSVVHHIVNGEVKQA